MSGYTRTDTSNNIADGNIVNAADLDGEYDAIQAAFNATNGHTHDGSTGEGKPITKVGPAQDVVVSSSSVTPKTTATVDIGSSSLRFKDIYISGTVNGVDATDFATKAGTETLTNKTITYADNTLTGVVGLTATQTLTNKRVTSRVNSTTTTTSPWAWNSDSYDQQCFTALANALTINADAGTPTDGQKAIFRLKDNGTARALTWTTGTSKSFRAVGVILPTTTIISKTTYVGCIYNADASRWDAVAVAQEV